MMLPNLFICLTPLQTLIAQRLIAQNTHRPAHLLMLCYADADNDKFHYYYQQIKQNCEQAHYHIIPAQTAQRIFSLRRLLFLLDAQYHTIFAASVDNVHVQYPMSHLSFEYFETFDDGTANLYPDSILYRTPPRHWARKILNKIIGIKFNTEQLRQLSRQHHTLYPNLPNIATPTVPLDLWTHSPYMPQQSPTQQRTILLGQPLFVDDADNIALFTRLLAHIQPDAYFPHPRERYRLENVSYIDIPLIFEDYLLNELTQSPEIQFRIIHLASTAALNVAAFDRVQVQAIRPDNSLFHESRFVRLYDLMQKMAMPVMTLPFDD